MNGMERALKQKLGHSDLKEAISHKANLADIKKTLEQVAINIESRVAYEDLAPAIKDKTSKLQKDLSYQLQQKVSYDDIKQYFEGQSSF